MSESSTSSNSSTSDKKIPKKVLLKEDISEFFNSLSTAMEEQFEILKKEVQEIRSMLESLKNSPHPQTIFVTGTIIFLFFFFFSLSIFQFFSSFLFTGNGGYRRGTGPWHKRGESSYRGGKSFPRFWCSLASCHFHWPVAAVPVASTMLLMFFVLLYFCTDWAE